MITQFGITPERLVAKGFGKLQLLDPSRPEDGVNRRVQIVNTGVEGARK
jgi:flagellar motor protein MotB